MWANEKPLVLSTAADGVMEKAFRDVVLSGDGAVSDIGNNA